MKRDTNMFRWVGLALILIGGFMGIIAGLNDNLVLTAIGIMVFVLGIFVLSRPNF